MTGFLEAIPSFLCGVLYASDSFLFYIFSRRVLLFISIVSSCGQHSSRLSTPAERWSVVPHPLFFFFHILPLVFFVLIHIWEVVEEIVSTLEVGRFGWALSHVSFFPPSALGPSISAGNAFPCLR